MPRLLQSSATSHTVHTERAQPPFAAPGIPSRASETQTVCSLVEAEDFLGLVNAASGIFKCLEVCSRKMLLFLLQPVLDTTWLH